MVSGDVLDAVMALKKPAGAGWGVGLAKLVQCVIDPVDFLNQRNDSRQVPVVPAVKGVAYRDDAITYLLRCFAPCFSQHRLTANQGHLLGIAQVRYCHFVPMK